MWFAFVHLSWLAYCPSQWARFWSDISVFWTLVVGSLSLFFIPGHEVGVVVPTEVPGVGVAVVLLALV